MNIISVLPYHTNKETSRGGRRFFDAHKTCASFASFDNI